MPKHALSAGVRRDWKTSVLHCVVIACSGSVACAIIVAEVAKLGHYAPIPFFLLCTGWGILALLNTVAGGLCLSRKGGGWLLKVAVLVSALNTVYCYMMWSAGHGGLP